MPIYCSNLTNDQDMIRALGSMAVPAPISFGDAVFFGVGDNDTPLTISCERKKLGDFASCILNGRYLYQAQRAKEAGMNILILIIEGTMRPSPEDGLLEIPVWGIDTETLRRKQTWQPLKPAITYSRFDQYLTELAYLANIIVKRSRDVHETASIIKALWVNFQIPPNKHNSLHQIFSPLPQQVQLVRPSLIRRVASELDSIGRERSQAVAEHFGTVYAMVNAGVDDWVQIPGIGKKIAEKVVQSFGGDRYRLPAHFGDE